MILRSIRLKNIKSYGSGPQDNGITVEFQPGVNCVAGRNGHGKTTLIEALGLALFEAKPDFEEKFALPTYFLRAGEKEAEIDVVFEHDGQAFRVERGLGQSKRRSKVVQLSDGSTCAEDDAAVAAFVCRLLGFKEPKQLSDLFSNLVGVKQGRLAWPFDSKPAAAKEFFEPLLDVAIFRQSVLRLNEAQGRFKELLEEQRVNLAKIQERLRERADSADKVPIKETEVEGRRRASEKSRQQKVDLDRLKASCELKQTAFDAARKALDQAKHQFALASQRRGNDQQRVNDSQVALQVVQRTAPGSQAYAQAEERLRVLQQQQSEKSALLHQKAVIASARTGWEVKREEARKQARGYSDQREERTKQAELLSGQLVQGKKTLEGTHSEFGRLEQATVAARRSRDGLDAWLENLAGETKGNERLLADILSNWEKAQRCDARAVNQARIEEQRLEETAVDVGRSLARAEESKATLTLQLAQINGGVCPFLKENCRQFDPKAVQSDLGDREKELAEIGRRHKEADEALKRARKTLETLREQEAQTARLKQIVGQNVQALVAQHNRLFPPAVRTNIETAQSYLPVAPEWHPILVESLPGNYWLDAESKLETQGLDELVESEKAFIKSVSERWKLMGAELDRAFVRFEKQRADRVRQERDLDNIKQNLVQADRDVKELTAKIDRLAVESDKAGAEASAAATRTLELEAKLKAFVSLDQEINEQHSRKDRHAEDHKLFLGAQPLAATLDERREVLRQSAAAEQQAEEQVRQKNASFESASRDFDPAALEKARNHAAEAGARLMIDEKALQSAERELQMERERLKQWKEACRERDRIEGEASRLRAAGELAKLAGKVLKGAAPAVAQHLCSRIAANAQRLFNQLNQEPIELEWKAEPQYGLRIGPGERRFAMLSGGEQTKLAVAMTLAMIQEFSALRFAVFDEPTYAVDAESRPKLADAILEAQKAAGLDQLIIVSHDDAFEGRIENVVVLRKLAGSGTELLNSPPLQPPVRP